MEIICHCLNGNCIQETDQILEKLENRYSSCPECDEIHLKKFSPLNKQVDLQEINYSWKLCSCGKRHLDAVMAHALKILIEEKVLNPDVSLRKMGTPLITPNHPLFSDPYLSKDSLVLLLPVVNKKSAERIVNEIPEIKGVIRGDMRNTVGIKDSESDPVIYELLAGCDMRCDVFNTAQGPVCIYKPQSQIHIELAKPTSPKITILSKYMEKFEHPTILDCTCGPGTLGIAALIMGAAKVVFNDLWLPAARSTLLNLQINGFKVNRMNIPKGRLGCGDNFEVYGLDVKDLKDVISEKFDLCLVDTFPGVDHTEFADSIGDICKNVVIID